MKRDGQALVEFIIILPVFIIIILGTIDFGMIFYQKNTLENNLDEVIEILKQDNSHQKANDYINEVNSDIKLNILEQDETTKIVLTNNYNPITPGLNLILKSPYEISVNRVIYNG